ncbi:hypothetical protein V8E54_002203 [Elaphomyces granulatus]
MPRNKDISYERLNFRRAHLLSALKSDRIQVLVGEEKREFQVPRDLLAGCSPVFNAMCNSAFKESVEGVIELPEGNPLTVGSFMLWLHSCPPAIAENEHYQVIINLAIFAETYQIHPLKNQTSDLIQKRLLAGKTAMSPSTMTKIYESTPDGSILQELFCLAFVTGLKTPLAPKALSEWESVLEQFPNFGRDYFRHNQQFQKSEFILNRTGTCYFHDHENMTFWDRSAEACPYPDGGDWIENERELQNKRKRGQEEFEPEKRGRRKGPVDVITVD